MKTSLLIKKLALMVIFAFGVIAINAQTNPKQVLKGTSWKGTALLPDAKQATLKFGDSKAEFIIEGKVVETMNYTTTTSNVITFTKINGSSSCGANSSGEFRYSVGTKGDLKFKLFNDDCTDRAITFLEGQFTKAN